MVGTWKILESGEEGEVRNHIPLPANYHKSVDKLRTPQDGIGNPFHPEFFAQPAF